MKRWLRRRRTRLPRKPIPLPKEPLERSATLRQFGGLWIAVWNDAIIAAGDTVDKVFWEMDEQHKPDASVTRVPDPKRGIPVGLG